MRRTRKSKLEVRIWLCVLVVLTVLTQLNHIIYDKEMIDLVMIILVSCIIVRIVTVINGFEMRWEMDRKELIEEANSKNNLDCDKGDRDFMHKNGLIYKKRKVKSIYKIKGKCSDRNKEYVLRSFKTYYIRDKKEVDCFKGYAVEFKSDVGLNGTLLMLNKNIEDIMGIKPTEYKYTQIVRIEPDAIDDLTIYSNDIGVVRDGTLDKIEEAYRIISNLVNENVFIQVINDDVTIFMYDESVVKDIKIEGSVELTNSMLNALDI